MDTPHDYTKYTKAQLISMLETFDAALTAENRMNAEYRERIRLLTKEGTEARYAIRRLEAVIDVMVEDESRRFDQLIDALLAKRVLAEGEGYWTEKMDRAEGLLRKAGLLEDEDA